MIAAAGLAVAVVGHGAARTHFDAGGATLLEAAGVGFPPRAYFEVISKPGGVSSGRGTTTFAAALGKGDDELASVSTLEDRTGQATELGMATAKVWRWMGPRSMPYVMPLVNAVESDLTPGQAAALARPIAEAADHRRRAKFTTPHANIAVAPWIDGYSVELTPR